MGPMRDEGGYAEIIKACEALGAPGVPEAHMAAYGEGNERRLTGLHETASINDYTYGVADRGASIRRPSSNMDPYRVNSMMVMTCCGIKGAMTSTANQSAANLVRKAAGGGSTAPQWAWEGDEE